MEILIYVYELIYMKIVEYKILRILLWYNNVCMLLYILYIIVYYYIVLKVILFFFVINIYCSVFFFDNLVFL